MSLGNWDPESVAGTFVDWPMWALPSERPRIERAPVNQPGRAAQR